MKYIYKVDERGIKSFYIICEMKMIFPLHKAKILKEIYHLDKIAHIININGYFIPVKKIIKIYNKNIRENLSSNEEFGTIDRISKYILNYKKEEIKKRSWICKIAKKSKIAITLIQEKI